MNSTLTTQFEPIHHQILVDYVINGLTVDQCSDKHAVSKGMIYSLKKSDQWEMESKQLLDQIKLDAQNRLSRLVGRSLDRIEQIIDRSSDEAIVLNAANKVIDKVVSKGGSDKSKVVLNMFAPGWHSTNGNKPTGEGNKVQIILGDKEYK